MRSPFTRGPVAATLTAALVLAAGCATGPSEPTSTGPAPSAASSTPGPATVSAEHDDADATFVQQMIPHHRQAVAMSALATGRAAAPQVSDLAAAIARAQDPEIARMTAMLAAWGVPEASDHGAHEGMPGMMGGDAMARLASLRGPAFDDAFLQMMIEHHGGAVEMARAENAQGRNPQALDLARSIAATQQQEIDRMRAMLR